MSLVFLIVKLKKQKQVLAGWRITCEPRTRLHTWSIKTQQRKRVKTMESLVDWLCCEKLEWPWRDSRFVCFSSFFFRKNCTLCTSTSAMLVLEPLKHIFCLVDMLWCCFLAPIVQWCFDQLLFGTVSSISLTSLRSLGSSVTLLPTRQRGLKTLKAQTFTRNQESL